MKRMLFILILALTLSGCQKPQPDETVSFGPPMTKTTEPETTVAETEPPLLNILPENGLEYVDESHILARVSSYSYNNNGYSSIYLLGNQLLLSFVDYMGEGGTKLTLQTLDLHQDAITHEISLDLQSYHYPQVREDGLIIADSGTGTIYFLDDELQITQTLNSAPNWYVWYLGDENAILYQDTYENGLIATFLPTQETKTLLPPSATPVTSTLCGPNLSVSFTDPETQLNCFGYLSLTNGQITTAPFDIGFNSATYYDGVWFGSLNNDANDFLIGGAGFKEAMITSLESGYYTHLTPANHLLLTDYNAQTLTLYAMDGTFLSSCSLAAFGDYPSVSSELCWSEVDGGYFFSVYTEAQGSSLYFWDLSIPAAGEPIAMIPFSEYQSNGGSMESLSDQYARAAALSEQYGVNIRIADQCDEVYSDFDAALVYDVNTISWGLDDLEKVLSSYPAGFFSQLHYGDVREIEISLVGSLTATNDYYDGGFYNAFAQQIGNKYLLVVDMYSSGPGTVHHEISHVIDQRLTWDANHRAGALYSEEAWTALSPADFEYFYEYDADWASRDTSAWEGYFIDGYAMSFPTEDRARTWEYACEDYDWSFADAPGLRAKLQYYSDCIRDCFDTTGWPAVTHWERFLQS